MPPDTPTNGRVTIAVVGIKVDGLTELVKQTNVSVDNMRREQGEMRAEMAVNEERWRNHDRALAEAKETHDQAQVEAAKTHEKLHQRERGVVGTLILVATTVSGSVSAWWASR